MQQQQLAVLNPAPRPPPAACCAQAPKNSAANLEAVDPEILAYREHQATAARISLPEEARTLVANAK